MQIFFDSNSHLPYNQMEISSEIITIAIIPHLKKQPCGQVKFIINKIGSNIIHCSI